MTKTIQPVVGFFERLSRRENELLLQQVTGSIRFDLAHEELVEHWFLSVDQGRVEVTREQREADCVLRTDMRIFEGMVCGEISSITAMLRGQIVVQGDLRLLMLLERVLPGPPGSHDPRAFARRERKQP